MIESGKKKRVVACAFDWPGWDRSIRHGGDVLSVLEVRDDPEALHAYRNAFAEAIRDHHARGAPARSWPVQFLIRRCAWHMLDHAWELQDRDLTLPPH